MEGVRTRRQSPTIAGKQLDERKHKLKKLNKSKAQSIRHRRNG